jgi:hypothetical protein
VASGLLSRVDRYGAHNSSRKSALSALYLAPDRRRSEPCMTVCPSVVHTHHLQARPRFFRITSKTENWSGIAIVSRSRGFHICVVPSRRRFKIHREGRQKLNRAGNAWIGFMSWERAAPGASRVITRRHSSRARPRWRHGAVTTASIIERLACNLSLPVGCGGIRVLPCCGPREWRCQTPGKADRSS